MKKAERCHCGEEALTPYAQWVAFRSEIHTPGRCGQFIQLRVISHNVSEEPELIVAWPVQSEVRA